MVKVTYCEIAPLECKHYDTQVYVDVVDNCIRYPFTISISGYHPQPSKREIDKGWEPDCGMDHVESEVHLMLAEIIAKALEDYNLVVDSSWLESLPDKPTPALIEMYRKYKSKIDSGELVVDGK